MTSQPDSNPILTVSNVSLAVRKGTEANIIARNLSLSLGSGEILYITGESGCGKSTFLRSLVRLQPFGEGTVTFLSRDIEEWNPAELRTRMIYLSQRSAFPSLPVRDILLMPFRFKVVQKAVPSDQSIKEVLQRFGLKEDFLDQPSPVLSGGEAERVALTRALLLDPTVLLLDEPTANLDAVNSARVVNALTGWIAKGQHSVIWVTHEQAVTDGIPGKRLILTAEGFKTDSESAAVGMAK